LSVRIKLVHGNECSPRLVLPAVGHNDFLAGLARLGTKGLHLLDDIHALDDLAEDDVLAVQPLRLGRAQEKLAAVCVGAGVSHRQDSRSGMLEGEVLVLKLVSVDGLAAGSVVVGEVAALAHEVGDHSVEGGPLEPVPLLAGAQGTEVLRGLGHHVFTELHDNTSQGCTVGGDIEEASHAHFGEVR